MKEITIELEDEDFRKLQAVARSHGKTLPAFVDGVFSPLLGTVVLRRKNDFSPGAMTAAQAKKQRKQLEREIGAQHKRTGTKRLAELRQQITAARKSTKPRRAEAVELCRIGRTMAKERAKALRIEGRAAIRQAIEQEKIAAREACAERKAKLKTDVKGDVERARRELREEKAFQREIRRIESSARKRERPRAASAEKRSESDDEVRANIPPDLVPLFERVKRTIKGSDRESRTESFLKYAEENEGEVISAIAAQAEREIARLQREEAKEHKALRRRGVSAGELAAVPF